MVGKLEKRICGKMVNSKQIQDSVSHIETVHSKMYNLTELRWFRSNQKLLIRICEKNIKELQDKIKEEKKQLKEHNAKYKAYVKVITLAEKIKASQKLREVREK